MTWKHSPYPVPVLTCPECGTTLLLVEEKSWPIFEQEARSSRCPVVRAILRDMEFKKPLWIFVLECPSCHRRAIDVFFMSISYEPYVV